MKRIYSVNNSKDVLGTLEGLKSMITSTKPVLYHVFTSMLFVLIGLFGVNEMAWGATATLNQSSNKGFGSTTGITFSISGLGNWTSKDNGTFSTSKHCAGYQVSKNTNAIITWSDVASGKCVNISNIEIKGTVASGATAAFKNKKMYAYTSVSTSNTTIQIFSSSGNTSAQSGSISGDTYLKDIGNNGSITMYSNDNPFYIESIVINYTIDDLPAFTFTINAITAQADYGSVTSSFDNSSFESGSHSLTVYGEKLSTTSVTQNVYFSAAPKTNCQFQGWFTNSECTAAAANPNTSTSYTTTLTNSTKGSTVTKNLYAKFDNMQTQTITWNQTINNNQIRGNEITLNATASSGLGVYYTASSANGATVSISGNKITCLTAGTITITAHQDGNAQYFASSNNPTKSFVIAEHAITKNPTATGITYEQKLSSSTLSGGTANVAGTWSWKFPNTEPAAGTANQVAVFTPSSSVISAYPIECNVSVTVAKATPDVTCTVNANTHYVDDTKIDLQSTWTREGDGAITYSVLSFEESGENNEDGTTPYIESNRYLHLGKAGTAQVKMAIAAGTNYIARNETIEVVINKHDPAFAWNTQTNYYYNTTVNNFLTKTSGASYTVTSSDEEVANMDGANLKIYNKAGTTKIKYVHPQTYKWNEKKDSVSFTPGWKNDTVSFSLTDANHTIYESANTFSSNYAYWSNDKDGYFLGATSMLEVSTKRENYAIIHFTGIPDTLYFNQRLNKYAAILPKDRVCYVMVSANGSTWNDTVWRQEAEIEYMNNQKVCLPSSTRYIKFYYNGTISSEYKNIRVSKRKYFKTDKASLDFATNVKNASCDAQTFKFHHAGAGYITSVSSSDSHFTVSPTSVTTGGEVCDSAVITVTYSTAEVGEHSGTITISDNIGNSTSVSVTGTTVDAYTPTITWPGTTSFVVGSTIANGFVAKDDNEETLSGTWSFESSDSTVIDIVKGELKAICGGTATITGTIAEGATWSSGSQTVSLTVTRNAASFTWSNVADDDKIHVWADSDIPSSIVSANTAINGLTSGNSDRLTVSGSKGSFTLHAGHKGEVTLTATSEGDCTYLNGTSSKTIVVEPCFQDIVWNQNFMGLMADENGDINTTITLTAYAVDSSGVATNKAITYSLDDNDFASIDGNNLRITGTGTTTIYATTADDNKYAVAEASLSIRVRTYGEACNTYLAYDKDEHHVSSYTNNKGKVYSWDGPADSIWVKVGKEGWATTQSLHIYTYDKDNNETDWQDWGVGSLSSDGENKRLKLPEGTVKIKFKGSGTQYKWYSNLIVTQKRYFTADKSSIDRGVGSPIPVNMPFSETITVSYSDVPLIQYSYTGQYLTLTPLQTVENDCGDYGTYSFVLSGVFPKVGSHNEHIYFRTSAGDEIDIPVTIAVTTNGTFRFDQTAGEWGESTNWTYGSETTHGMTPTIANDVIIEKNVTVVGEVSAYGVTIMPGATVTVAPTGGLTVGAGGVRYSTKDNLILQAGTEDPVKGKTGYLRISPHYTDTMPHAKVELYSIAYHNISSDESDDAKWQHVGIPVATDALAKTFFSKSWIYSYEESSDTWVNNRKTLVMEPFVGYATTQYKSEAGMLVTFPGQLVPNRGTKIIDLEYSGTSYGHNRIANSYAAPIDITQFRDTDFIRAEKTIYIYNTGSKNNSSLAKSATGNNAGQWTAVSIGTAAEMAERFAEDPSLPKTIAPMQGFCVNAQAAGAKFKLNYNKLVWNADYTSHAPTALRAPKRNADAAEEEEMPITGSMKMTLEANGLTDNIYLLESERYMADFEDGYDAHKMESGTLNIFTVENEDKLAIDATNSIIGTRVGVRTGEETAYTITFSYVDGEQEWALYDAETDEMIDITNDNTYTFFAEPNSNITERFMIVESNGAQIPAVTTGNDKVTSDVRAHKFIKDGELFILKNGVLYDVTGARVK